MKKYLIAIMMLMALLLTACGSDAPAKEAEALPAATEAAATEASAVTEAVATEAPAETEAALEEKNVTIGRMEGDSYVNEYAGYAIDLSGWTVSPAEVLQELPKNVEELIGDTEIGQNSSALGQFTDVLAENAETLQSINLLYRKSSLQDRLAYAVMSEQEILEGILSMQDQMAEAYAQAGILVEKMEIVDITFLGESRKALLTTTTMQNVPYITLQIFEYNKGAYALTLTLASFVENTTESMLDLFTKVG